MSEVIQNGNFSQGLDHWTNWYFTVEAGRIKGMSNPGDANEKNCIVQQAFAVNDMVIDAKISAWRRYESVSGGVSDGYVRSRVGLVKPDSTTEWLVNDLKTAQNGEGLVLNNEDITSKFTQQGNYKIHLASQVASAKNETQTSIANPYSTWTNNGFTIVNPNCKLLSGQDYNEHTATIYKDLTVDAACHYGRLSVEAKGIVNSGEELGYARFIVKFGKVGQTPATLYDGYLDDTDWHTILNNLDISSYLTSAGTYRLTLEARVKSTRITNPFPPPTYLYQINEAWFGSLSLVAKWYTYTVSNGYWDNITLDIKIKKFKTVFEVFGMSEVPQKKAKVSMKEDVELAESYSTRTFLGKVVSEILELAESFTLKVKKTVKEDLELAESWFTNISERFQKQAKEDLELTESYSMILRKRKEVKEDFELAESLSAKKIAGNIETTYLLGKPTEWESVPPVVTPWIKKKTIIGSQ